MKRFTYFVFCLIATIKIQAQNFSQQWHVIDSLIVEKDLPKSALEKVNALYTQAKQLNSNDDVIRALLYRMNLEEKTTEQDVNYYDSTYTSEILTTANVGAKSILLELRAKNLNDYYNIHFWQNNSRTDTKNFREQDITTWSNQQLLEKIDSLFAIALTPANELQKINISAYNSIILQGNTPQLRNTLYDLLAHEALDYYKTGIRYITEPAYAFKLTDQKTLAPAGVFMNTDFSSVDSNSHQLKALRLFQDLMKWHSSEKDLPGLIDVDIERIEWVNSLVSFDDKESLYKKSLEFIAQKYSNEKAAAEAWYLLVKIESDKAASYSPFGDTANRYAYVVAKKMIEERLIAMPDSCYGNNLMKNLLQTITHPEINTTVESVNVSNSPFRLLIKYKNTDTVYARFLNKKELDKKKKGKKFDYWKDISKISYTKSFQQPLPQTNDYQEHAVEIKMDALPVGDYLVLFSNTKSFITDSSSLAAQEITISDLAYLKNEKDYFVVNRESGQPIEKVKVTGTVETRKTKTAGWKKNKVKLYTDAQGHFVLPVNEKEADNIGGADLHLQYNNDKLDISGDIYGYRYSYNNDEADDAEDDSTYEDDNSIVHFFTDRSIYRPGQTVFFKGIVLTKDRKTKQKKLYNYKDSVEIDLNDANGKMIDSAFVLLNDYGSFAGKFKIPENTLTGQFSIDTYEFTDGEATFSVEEYKRPTFYVEFDTLKSTYRLNDTIHITGYAKAYAGNSIDLGKLKYNIQRTASFPYPYLFWKISRPYSAGAQIADSTITLDKDGKFDISFIAVPDSAVGRSTEPVFNFEIEASVTDDNGETRETKTSVQVAYKSIVLQLNIPGIAETQHFKNLFITTKNNAGENIAANVHVTVTPLEVPVKASRKRLWERPDQYVMTKTEYSNYFPYDEYDAETDYHEWKKLPPVIEDDFNTANTSSYTLTKNLQQGWYCIEASAIDKDGNTIKDIRYIQLYDLQSAGLPAPQENFTQNISNTGQVGDKAQLLIGSSEENVFGILKTDRSLNDSLSFFSLNNNKKQIDYTIQSSDVADFGMYYAFIKHNRFYTGGMRVYITTPANDLQVSYASYRNKTEPGSKETWSVQVSHPDNSKADAELLTSMYDASLDQFKKQEWEKPVDRNYTYVSNDWDGEQSFAKNSLVKEIPSKYIYNIRSYNKLLTTKNISLKFFTSDGGFSENITNSTQLQGRIPGISVNNELNDVVVTGYGTAKKKEITGSVAIVQSQQLLTDTSYFYSKARSLSGTEDINNLLVIIDDIITGKKLTDISPELIQYVTIYKGAEATALYGSKASNGAIVITTKEYALRHPKKEEEQPVQVRKNFNETAFFFPQLHADSISNYTFSFTMPDALTQWKWMSFAHTKDLGFGLRTTTIQTQKILMVQPNLPRFLREGDQLELSAKISNLSDTSLTGTATLELLDATTNQPIDGLFQNVFPDQYFTAEAGQSTVIKFPVSVPFSFSKPLTVRIVAKAGRFSDGEENTLPVLSNRLLVTESLPLYLPGETSKEFRFEKLLHNESPTLTNQSLTIEYTTDPVWSAMQALPYIVEYPHECAEQTFNRFFANALAAYVIGSHPGIAEAFEKWKADTTHFISNLEQNPELKQILINETPWVLDAENETQQRKNIALLFDKEKIQANISKALQQLQQMQLSSGAFPWFSGGYEDRYITQYILTGIGRLEKMGALKFVDAKLLKDIETKALHYADEQIENDKKTIPLKDISKNNLGAIQVQYLFMRSFFKNIVLKKEAAAANDYYLTQSKTYWTKNNNYIKAMIAAALYRTGQQNYVSTDILPSIMENAVADSTTHAIHWKNNNWGYYWYEDPVSQHSIMIELLNEMSQQSTNNNVSENIAGMQTWLLLNKQTNNWYTTKATADACYALLLNADFSERQPLAVTINAGNETLSYFDTDQQNNAGYMKKVIPGDKVTNEMGNITVAMSNPVGKSATNPPTWGAVYWQYFEDMNNVTAAATSLSVTKNLFIETNTAVGKQLLPVNNNSTVHPGDKIIIRLIIKADRDMDYLQLKDLRAAAMEPDDVLSGYNVQSGLSYYQSTKDASTNFFISHISKGTYVLQYPVHITHTGTFSSGIATVQCMYAPEFSAHSNSILLNVETGN